MSIKQILILFLLLVTGTAFGADKVFYYHTDPAGTPLAMTDSMGTVVWKADNKPFGEGQATTGIVSNDKTFVGKEKDKESGLHYFGARYLKDDIGRFLAVDPVGAVDARTNKVNEKLLMNPQRLNAYAYSLNNPYRYVDADGKFALPVLFLFATYLVLDNSSQADAPTSMSAILPAESHGETAFYAALSAAGGPPVPGKSTAIKSVGKTVLGHYPAYMLKAEEIGAKRFNIPSEVWNKMTDAEKWTANQKFLDRMIARGDEVVLATSSSQARPGSFFAKELDYLGSRGYSVSADGTRMLPPGN